MTGIGGPGGIGGPKGPSGPSGPDDIAEAADAPAVSGKQLDAMVAALKSGQLNPQQAIDRMVDDASAGMGQAEKAELRELIVDLVANDPYLASLVGRI